MPLKTIAMIVTEPVAVFEFGVVVEVFGIDRQEEGVAGFELRICGQHPGRPLRAKASTPLSIIPSHGLDAVAGADLVVLVPATPDHGPYPAEVIETVQAAYAAGSTILSICSAAFLLGEAGLLDGRDCTTHWMYTEALQRRHPSARVDPRVLFVDTGQIITSAGTASGVDACLHLVRREYGAAMANKIARRMVVPPQRDGGQQQFLPAPVPECASEGLAELLDWVRTNLEQPHTVASLAGRANLSERSFARRFLAETGTTPHQWLTQQRVLAARELLESTDDPVERIASQVGFNSAVVLRDHFRRSVGVAPLAYRRRFC
ncbi:transcriptional regulator GlxA family with amidase domain [Propionicimonas paludicola]|uniref:Transcriptional regulator GlxA family with amidase domain n=1 Tax=Propionicimonas paludicola TaxID=185243 RepID=A0A2A9CPS2_9ACTN|nr:helix-turn-helix domain-containing protein [Propionicimonas paludicola]PFG15660.1 transcriptional regulator GlxA family with amidase domain [Propionicimonas paludicola]